MWPEDVVDTDRTVTDTELGALLSDLAVRLDTTVVAGVVEDDGEDTVPQRVGRVEPRR